MKIAFSSRLTKRLALASVILALGIALAVQFTHHRSLLPGASPQALVLTKETKDASLTPYIRLFEDRQKVLTAKDVLTLYNSGSGEQPAGDRLHLGYTHAAWWLVFTIENNDKARPDWMLDLGRRNAGTTGAADRIAFYSDDDKTRPLALDGRHVVNKTQMAGQAKNALPLPLDGSSSRTFALMIEPTPGLPLAVNPRVVTQADHAAEIHNADFAGRLLNVALFLLLVLSFVFLLHFNSLTPALLAAYAAAQFLIYRNTDELVSLGNNTGAVYLDALAALGGIAALMLAQRLFFPERENHGAVYRLLGTGAVVLALTAAFGIGSATASQVTSPFLLRVLPLLLPAAILVTGLAAAVRQKHAPAVHVYTLSWLALFLGAAASEAGIAGLSLSGDVYWSFFAVHIALLAGATLHFTYAVEPDEHASLSSTLGREKKLSAEYEAAEDRHRKELSEAQAVAESATKSRADFLAIVSHEIRTPMTGIMGMIRLLVDTPLTDKQREYIDTLQYSCNALLALINDILDFSKIGAQRMDIETVSFDLKRLLDGVIHLMNARAGEKNIALKTEIDPKLPLFFKGDPTRLRQILLNLLGNSIKFTDKGSVTLIVKAAGTDETGKQRVYFAVQDTGIGMAKDVLAKVFVPYAQGHTSIARRYGGTGLGLSISQQLVHAMGGTVEVTSELGQGTTFFFTIAMEEGVKDDDVSVAAHIPAIPLRVLIVDDNGINQKVVLGLLEPDKHTLAAVSGGREALNELELADFDVVLMDMEMPDLDGPATARLIRALPDKKKAAVPIIAMTSNTSPEDIKTCLDAGMNDHCRKPIDLDQLRGLLLQVAKKEGAFKQASTAPAAAAPVTPPPVPTLAPAAEPPKKPEAPVKPPVPFNTEILGTLKSSMSRAQMDDMMKSFYDKTDELIASAEKAVADRDPKAISGRAHDIKGMTANFGLIALSEVAAKLSKQAKEGASQEALLDTVNQLRPVYADTRKIVEDWVAS